jgi:hypothetical protein
VLNNLILAAKPFMGDIFEGSKAVEICRSKIWDVLRVGKNSPSSVIASCVLKRVWKCIVSLKEDFGSFFARSNSPEMLLQGFKSFKVQT